MPEYLSPGVYVEEIDTGVHPIPGVSTDEEALKSLASEFRRILRERVPEWADINESDPGVTLIEIFAFLTEGLLFRSNQIPPRGRSAALRAAAALAALGGVPDPGFEVVKRPLFFTGQLLDAGDLAAEQDYQREKRRLHNRAVFGYGIVSGLGVRIESAGVVISPGVAIDARGEEISLPRDATLRAPRHGDGAFVTIRCWERVCPSQPPTEGAAPGHAAVEEACVLGIVPSVNVSALTLARLVRSKELWQLDPAFVAPRVRHGSG